MTAYKIIITGRVQGVGFRNYVLRTAIDLKVNGYVKNLKSGEVHVVAEAKKDVLEVFLDYCKIGSDASDVQSVNYKEVEVSKFNYFQIQI
ncbi:MAG: acylphosphatase [Bacteroidales bacterium]|nr:acylphosphatase [Bacteroidales bacterium]